MRGLFVLTLTLLALLISINASYHKLENIVEDKECKRNAKVLWRKIKANKSTNIPCCINGHSFPEITWYKDESELSMPNGSTVINNVRYQQKGARLLISRTDVHGSGNYQCLARNSAGYKKGEIYQVIFYESGTNQPKQSNVIKANYSGDGNFVGNPNKTVNDEYLFRSLDRPNGEEEEEEGKEATDKEKDESGETSTEIVETSVVVLSFASLLFLVLVVIWFRKKHNSSSGHTSLNKETVEENDESVDEKRANINDKFKPTCDVTTRISESSNFKEYQPETSGYCSSSNLLSCSDVTVGFNFSPQNIANTSTKKFPLVSSRSCSCSTTDTKILPANPCTFCYVLERFRTELSVDIRDDDETGISTRSDMPSSSCSNTSELFDELEKIPPNANKRYFSSTFIDHNGGELILEGTGIKLVVPEGAIDEGKTEVVKLALLGNPEYAPKEEDGDTSLTPVVICGPHGLRFKKHVMLVLPHCVAVSDEMEENFRVLCSDTEPETAPDWKEIFNNNDEVIKEVFCCMEDQQFCLFLRHFSWYNIRGQGKARDFRIVAYHTSFHQPNEEFKVRIYFLPNLKNSSVGQKRINEAEGKLQGTLSDAEKTKIFRKKGGDMKVEASEISEGWNLIGQNVQTESYNLLYSCCEGSPNRTFRFQHVLPRPEKISCKFTVLQDDCKFDTPTEISMSLHFESEIKRARIQHNSNNGISQIGHASTTTSSEFFEVDESTTGAFIPKRLRDDLVEMLDPVMVGMANWEDLAEHLGYKLKFVRWLKKTPEMKRAETLLNKWENDVIAMNKSPEDALASLQQIFLKMKRMDAAETLQTYISNLQSGKETPV